MKEETTNEYIDKRLSISFVQFEKRIVRFFYT